jgi:hypothetical protein
MIFDIPKRGIMHAKLSNYRHEQYPFDSLRDCYLMNM